MKVLITSGYGNINRNLIPKLLSAGIEVRVVDIIEENKKHLEKLGVKDIIIGDIRRTDVAERAVQGVDKIYLVLPTALSRVVGMSEQLIDLAIEAKVEHFVFSSCLNSVAFALRQHREKVFIEDYLVGSPINYTILQPAAYIDATKPLAGNEMFKTKKFHVYYSMDIELNWITLDDISSAAAQVLQEGKPHYFATYPLCSGCNYTFNQLCDICDEITGEKYERDIVPIPVVSDPTARELFGRIVAYHSNHHYRGNPYAFRALTGRSAATPREYLEKAYKTFLSGVEDSTTGSNPFR